MKAAIRVAALDLAALRAAEEHGKRKDASSKLRVVRDSEPLFFGSLNLLDAFQEHVADAKASARLKKPVLHALVQFPTALELTPELEFRLLEEAVNFINESHGGNAVFAARLDRDEQGRHTVDVFFSPKYLKETAATRRGDKEPELWLSTTRHGKELALKHQDEIRERLDTRKDGEDGKPRDDDITSPRAVGIALQSELAAYLTRKPSAPGAEGFGMGDVIPRLEPRKLKATKGPDRLDVEEFKRQQDEAREKALKEAEAARAEAEASRLKALEKEERAFELFEEFEAKSSYVEAEAAYVAEGEEVVSSKFEELEARTLAVTRRESELSTTLAHVEQQRRKLEEKLREVSEDRSRILRLGDLIAGLIKNVATKLGVSPQLSEIERGLEEIRKMPEPEKTSLVDVLKEKYSANENPPEESGPGF